MADETYFGEEGDKEMLIGVLKEEMAKDPNWANRIDEIGRTKATKPLGVILPAAVGLAVVLIAAGGILLYKKKSKPQQ
jgi:hypothetical protein